MALVSSCWVVTEVQKRGKFPAFHLVTELEAYGKVGFTLGCGVAAFLFPPTPKDCTVAGLCMCLLRAKQIGKSCPKHLELTAFLFH